MIKKRIMSIGIIFFIKQLITIDTFKHKLDSIILEDSFLKSFCPRLYDLDRFFSTEVKTANFKNFIDLATNDNLIYVCEKISQSDKQQLTLKILNISRILQKWKRSLLKPYDKVGFFQSIEIELFNFFFNKLNFIINLKKNKYFKTEIYNKQIQLLTIIIIHFKAKKDNLIRKSKFGIYKKEKILFLQNFLGFLEDKHYANQKKVYIYDALLKPCEKYFENYKRLNTKTLEDNMQNEKSIMSSKNNNDLAIEFDMFKEIFYKGINFTSENIDLEIEKIIHQIYSVCLSFYENNQYKLQLEHFLMIHIYYNYIISQISLQLYNLEKGNDLDSSYLNKYNRILKILKDEKYLVSDLTKTILINYHKKIKMQRKFKNIKILLNFLEKYFFIDAVYDKCLDFLISEKSDKQLHDINFNFFKSQSENLKIDIDLLDLCEKHSVLFQTHFMFVSRCCLMYFYATKNYAKSIGQNCTIIIEANNDNIDKILEILKKNENENINIIDFLKGIKAKNIEILYIIYHNKTTNTSYKNIEESKKMLFEQLIFERNLFDISKDLYNRHIFSSIETNLSNEKICFKNNFNHFIPTEIEANSNETE
ncbi:hypothetical protein NUSPORA_01376 [Nucleospora cyclopteri]